MHRKLGVVAALLLLALPGWASEVDDLRQQLNEVRGELKELRQDRENLRKQVDQIRNEKDVVRVLPPGDGLKTEATYGPDAQVTTRQGRLKIGGLLNVWYQGQQNDTRGYFPAGDDNNARQVDGFRLRRTRLHFTMDINSYVTGFVMLEPTLEANCIGYPTNLGYRAGPVGSGSTAYTNIAGGAGKANSQVLDTWVKFHDVVPNTEFQVGQMVPPMGEEALHKTGELDFVERSLVAQCPAGDYDIGAMVIGKYFDERVQYKVGVFNTAGNYLPVAPQYNRVDNNEFKDVAGALVFRPLWDDDTFGSIEIGGSGQYGKHGSKVLAANAAYGPYSREVAAWRTFDYLFYRPGGAAKGLWAKTEWGWTHDMTPALFTYQPGVALKAIAAGAQTAPKAPTVAGMYASIGYKLADSACKDIPSQLKPFEFAFRYERFDNFVYALTDGKTVSNKTYTKATTVYTAGINYYLKGHYAKLQANYNWIKEPDFNAPHHELRNDSFALAFQVMF